MAGVFDMEDEQIEREIRKIKIFLVANRIPIVRIVPAISRGYLNKKDGLTGEFIKSVMGKIKTVYGAEPVQAGWDISATKCWLFILAMEETSFLDNPAEGNSFKLFEPIEVIGKTDSKKELMRDITLKLEDGSSSSTSSPVNETEENDDNLERLGRSRREAREYFVTALLERLQNSQPELNVIAERIIRQALRFPNTTRGVMEKFQNFVLNGLWSEKDKSILLSLANQRKRQVIEISREFTIESFYAKVIEQIALMKENDISKENIIRALSKGYSYEGLVEVARKHKKTPEELFSLWRWQKTSISIRDFSSDALRKTYTTVKVNIFPSGSRKALIRYRGIIFNFSLAPVSDYYQDLLNQRIVFQGFYDKVVIFNSRTQEKWEFKINHEGWLLDLEGRPIEGIRFIKKKRGQSAPFYITDYIPAWNNIPKCKKSLNTHLNVLKDHALNRTRQSFFEVFRRVKSELWSIHPELKGKEMATAGYIADALRMVSLQNYLRNERTSDKIKYTASKAAADLLIQSYMRTYRMPALIVRGSNNYGSFQYHEKIIPLAVSNIIECKKVPIHGSGEHKRSWLHVDDFCNAIDIVIHKATDYSIFNVSGEEKSNLEILEIISKNFGGRLEDFKEHTNDRPGADLRYAPDSLKLKSELRWVPNHCVEESLKDIINWYRNNQDWWRKIKSKKDYLDHYERQVKAEYY